ncbi:MAG: alpha/beta fold hydrolase [Pseudonocardiaceae bacterium]|nr:alpha/beta fold hydrolase [Pseudonocardiaceae bacterium]
MKTRSRFVVVDGIRTHYLEAGEGRPVVLLHAGEFGGGAQLSWEQTIPALAERYRVIAPDWLGFGETDKLHDFTGGQSRRLWHMTRFLEVLAVGDAAFVGNSMGGTLLAKVAAAEHPEWPITALVLASGGGFVPFNQARRQLVDYDGSAEGMRDIVRTVFYDERFARDDAYVQRRHRASLAPGAWEAAAAARLKPPTAPERDDVFGQPDTTPYELIDVPTLLVAGADDRLREPGYADELHKRIRGSRLSVFSSCGHLPQLEHPAQFNDLVTAFLSEVYPARDEQ